MSNVQGIVERVNKSDKTNMWSVRIGGEWFGAGKYQPKFKEGDEVTFDFSMNGEYKNMTFNTVKVLDKAPEQPASAAPSKAGAVDWDAKDERITFLSCRNSAIEVVKVALNNDAISLPTKKADKLDAIVGIVDELSNDFFFRVYDKPYKDEPTDV